MARLAIILVALACAGPAVATTTAVGPGDTWCSTINAAVAGDEIILLAGTYTRPCAISAVGSAAEPILVRSEGQTSGTRAVMAYAGSTSNVIDFVGSARYVILRGLAFQPTQPAVDAVKIKAGDDLVIEQCLFEGLGGISIAANTTDSQRITVRDNVFLGLQTTGLYFGCHNGVDCHATDILIEGNLIDGVVSPGVGYGLEIKLNSWGTVRDNTIYNTQGPCLMVYGSNRGDPPSLVEGNYVEASTNDGGIVLGGGAAIVRNNVVVASDYGGIVAQDYAGRDLMDNVWIVHNTLLGNGSASIRVQSWEPGRGNVLAFNAIAPGGGGAALNPASPVGTVTGNIECDPASICFVDPSSSPYDLWPTISGGLVDAAGSGSEPWRPQDDFMGTPRGAATDVGAFERTADISDHRVGGGTARPPRSGGASADGGPGDDGALGDARSGEGGPSTDGGPPPDDTSSRDAVLGSGCNCGADRCPRSAAGLGWTLLGLAAALAISSRRRVHARVAEKRLGVDLRLNTPGLGPHSHRQSARIARCAPPSARGVTLDGWRGPCCYFEGTGRRE
ncbi:MAG: right-handed parallel beta-helix repeat-containing protein [Myxococcota bacterium]